MINDNNMILLCHNSSSATVVVYPICGSMVNGYTVRLSILQLTIDCGDGIFCMKEDPSDLSRAATGGKENDLKLFDLNRPDMGLVFKAKNVSECFAESYVESFSISKTFFATISPDCCKKGSPIEKLC